VKTYENSHKSAGMPNLQLRKKVDKGITASCTQGSFAATGRPNGLPSKKTQGS